MVAKLTDVAKLAGVSPTTVSRVINKKGYHAGVICHHCGHIPQCDRCSVAVNYHLLPSGEKLGICHICKKQYTFPKKCENC